MATITKVKVGKEYIYQPVIMDVCDPKTNLKAGDKVKVVNQRGCPPANTMGHCHVEFEGKFVGLVHCNSLQAIESEKPVKVKARQQSLFEGEDETLQDALDYENQLFI